MSNQPTRSPIQQGFRFLSGLSLASLWSFATRGPASARKVVGSTLAAAWPKRNPWMVSSWDIVRAFAVRESLVIRGGDWTDGSTSPLERLLMVLLLRNSRPKKIVEVGTYRGNTTCLLLDNMGADALIYTIDLPPEVSPEEITAASDARLIIHRKVGIEYQSHPLAGQVTQILGDSFSDETWRQIPEGVDFAFIDASHSYEAVRNDSEKLWPKLSPEAVVIWHDYTESVSPERGVGKYIRELMPTHPDIFLCEGTDMAFRIPESALREGVRKMPDWYPDGSFSKKHPEGVPAWQRW